MEDDGFELIDKSELMDGCEAEVVLFQAAGNIEKEAHDGTADHCTRLLESYFAVILAHASHFGRAAYQAAAFLASIASKKICTAWQHFVKDELSIQIVSSMQPAISRANALAAKASSAAEQGFGALATFTDQAFCRAFQKAEHMQGRLFPPAAQPTGKAPTARITEAADVLVLIHAWLFAALQYLVHELVLFALFVQEISLGVAHRVKGCLQATP